MPITPNPEAVLTVTQLMEKTLMVLHEVVELEHEHPKEVMVLMMAFITGITIQLKDKLETDSYQWDTKTIEDGRYELRITASDEKSNTNNRNSTCHPFRTCWKLAKIFYPV